MEELDLRELFNIFWNKRIEIIIITLIFVIIGGIYSFAFTTPKYKSSTTLVLATLTDTNVGKSQQSNSEAITQTDLTLNSNLVSTYSELIKSKSVLREVINNLDIKDLNEEELKKDVKVSAVSDTELIEISVSNKKPSYASKIANEIANVFTKKVGEIYNINNVHIVDKAENAKEPYNINHLKDLIIFAFVGVVLAAAKILLLNMLDNTVKNEQDIEKNTGLLVIAQIPEFSQKGGKK